MSKSKKKKSFNKRTLSNKILGIFSNNPTKSYNYKQIAQKFEIKDIATKQLITTILYEFVEYENLIEVYKGKFKFKSKGGFVTGTVDLTSKGYAHIITDDIENIVYVSKSNLNHALHNDKVKVYLYAKRKSRHFEGEVVEIIERTKSSFVGTLEITRNFAFLVPSSKTMPVDIFIPQKNLNKAENGQKVIAKIIDWPKRAKNPVGEIVEILGYPGENEAEIHAILAEFDLPLRFPDNIFKAADKIEENISKKEIAKRRDFRKITTFTIDPEDAKDFDDAISIEKINNGNWEIGIHIADVTHYINQETVVDKEAYKRATSIYLVDRVVPMLPERLSNNLCSLRANEDKLCFSAVFEIDKFANIHNEWFGKTIINSDRRFTYNEAQKVIETKTGELNKEILILNDIAIKLRQRRFENGAINIESSEVKFKLDELGKPVDVFFKESKEANHLVEEFMLLANKKVAEFIGKSKTNKKTKTFVYRIHDKPPQEKLFTFNNFIKRFGHKIQTKSNKSISGSINSLLKKVRGSNEQSIIETMAIRSMAKAEYSVKNIGHYGLSFDYYTHFTSPIRRYPDMMVHRLLERYLDNGKSVNNEKYIKMCKHSSEMEQKAEKAERASIKYKQVEFMQDKIGKVFEGIISGVTEWGIFVEIIENKCEGMIHLRELGDDFYIYDEDNKRIFGQRTNNQYVLGDKVRIIVASANLAKKQLDFKLVNKL
ncbi:MAG: ribonuclease R [Bacteroidales bacterium]|nr:ribonuclease R [Bacteroidales bacterium]